MPALSLCFQVHQPYRLRQFSFFDVGRSTEYFDIDLTKSIMESLVRDVYTPAIAAIEEIQEGWGGEFRCSFYISGTAIEQMREFAPMALNRFRQLAQHPSIEILGGTYYHSLASLLDRPEEFAAQCSLHREVLAREFDCQPTAFFSPVYQHSDPLAERVRQLGYSGIVFGGCSNPDTERGPEQVYRSPASGVGILRCCMSVGHGALHAQGSIKQGDESTLAALVERLQKSVDKDGVVCVLVDCGAHDVASGEVSIPALLQQLVETALRVPGWRFVTPSQAIVEAHSSEEPPSSNQQAFEGCGQYKTDLLANSMQRKAFEELYTDSLIREFNSEAWRRLQAADHFRNMSTYGTENFITSRMRKPFESPYDVFIAYMNVLRSMSQAAKN